MYVLKEKSRQLYELMIKKGYPEDFAELCRMRGKQVAVKIVDPDQPLPLEYDDEPEPEYHADDHDDGHYIYMQLFGKPFLES